MALSVVLFLVSCPIVISGMAYTGYRITYKRNHPPELTYEDRKALYEKSGDQEDLERMLKLIKED